MCWDVTVKPFKGPSYLVTSLLNYLLTVSAVHAGTPMAEHPAATAPFEPALLLSHTAPGCEPPVLAHPHAVAYESAIDMLYDIVPGDQVMVMAPSGYYHHCIFVGKQRVAGIDRSAVVDFWGDSKERARIGMRSFRDFVLGAVGFAKADYPQGAALQHEMSARLALAWVDADKVKPTRTTSRWRTARCLPPYAVA